MPPPPLVGGGFSLELAALRRSHAPAILLMFYPMKKKSCGHKKREVNASLCETVIFDYP
jgi:hypothetical protein